MNLPNRVWILLTLQSLLFSAFSLISAHADFYLNIGPQNRLVVTGSKGEKIVELPLSSISRRVVVDHASFQVSYGRDANDLLTAILSPSPEQPASLHFRVLNKKVDADNKAVVTLTFSSTGKQVHIDPGLDGLVQVNSTTIKSHQPTNENSPADIEEPGHLTSTRLATQEVVARVDSSTVTPTVSMTILPPTQHISAPPQWDTMSISESPTGVMQDELRTRVVFYWSEPVASPEGVLPQVAVNEMKLLEVQGPVFRSMPDGSMQQVSDGMALPSDSTLITRDHASVAVLMGGVDSVRLLPHTQARITHHLDGSVRNVSIALEEGIAFSRVGHRANETENYQVITPEGVATANGTEFADIEKNHRHFLFVARGQVDFSNGDQHTAVTASPENLGREVLPPENLTEIETYQTLFDALQQLQPFNHTLPLVIEHMQDEAATAAEIAYYNKIRKVIFDPFDYLYEDELIPLVRRSADQTLEPFGTEPLTPF